MRDPDSFEEFYQATRPRLLLETYALTGDRAGAQSAVREGYVAAWHHWRKVSGLADREGWVRAHAWARALRRHHDDDEWQHERDLDERTAETLAALAALPVHQRKALVLTELARLSTVSMAREIGYTDAGARSELDAATTAFSQTCGISPLEVDVRLRDLQRRLDDVRFPRTSAVRRVGTRRRRSHTAIAIAAGGALVLGAGFVVHQDGGAARGLGDRDAVAQAEPEPELRAADLVDRVDVAAAVKGRDIVTVTTDDNTEGSGRYALCQREASADPQGRGTLVRRFALSERPTASAMQAVELSRSPEAAEAAYDRIVAWYSGCTAPRAQLLSTHRLGGVGEEALVVALRDWERPATTHLVAVARTGNLVSSTTLLTRGELQKVKLGPLVSLTSAAVTRLCASESGGTCVADPALKQIAPLPADKARGLLQEIDLPPVGGVDLPWVGSKPQRAVSNSAATRCDNTSFRGKQIEQSRTRSYVIPGAELDNTFGITETYGRFKSTASARAFVTQVRDKMAACDDDDLTVDVVRTAQREGKQAEYTAWRMEAEISKSRSVTYLMAIVRRGNVVAQVGFVPDGPHNLPAGGFDALTARALERLENLPSR